MIQAQIPTYLEFGHIGAFAELKKGNEAELEAKQ